MNNALTDSTVRAFTAALDSEVRSTPYLICVPAEMRPKQVALVGVPRRALSRHAAVYTLTPSSTHAPATEG